jgi:hypothetical protein
MTLELLHSEFPFNFYQCAINEYKVNEGTNHSEGCFLIKNYSVSISYTQKHISNCHKTRYSCLAKFSMKNRATLKVYSKKEYTLYH